MAVLTKEAETRILNLLLAEGLVDPTLAANAQNTANDGPILDKLIEENAITGDMVSHATAIIIGVPYIELKNVMIDQDILIKIPYETQVHGNSTWRQRRYAQYRHGRCDQRSGHRLHFQFD